MAMSPTIDFESLSDKLRAVFDSTQTPEALYEAVANAPFESAVEMAFIFLGFICFYLVDEDQQQIYLAGVSDNDFYHESVSGYNFDPALFRIQLDDPKNLIARSIRQNGEVRTEDWEDLSRPEAKDGAARINQATAGIGYSIIRPLTGKNRGAVMFSYYQYQDHDDTQSCDFMERYTKLVSEACDQLLEANTSPVTGQKSRG